MKSIYVTLVKMVVLQLSIWSHVCQFSVCYFSDKSGWYFIVMCIIVQNFICVGCYIFNNSNNVSIFVINYNYVYNFHNNFMNVAIFNLLKY